MFGFVLRNRGFIIALFVLVSLAIFLPSQDKKVYVSAAREPVELLPSVTPMPVYAKPVVNNSVYMSGLSARAALVYDVSSGTVLYENNIDSRLLPASTTKIMTALVALDEYALDEVLTVTKAQESIGSTAELVRGDQFRIVDVLRALMISSGNDAAVALALHHPKGYDHFVMLMNLKARSLGLENSHYANVSGIESPNHYMSARDLMELTQVAMRIPLIRDIVATKRTTIQTVDGSRTYVLESTNKLLDTVLGVEGVKTGWTGNAKECLVTQTKRSNATLITVVLGSDDRFGDSEQLIEWAYANHDWVTP